MLAVFYCHVAAQLAFSFLLVLVGWLVSYLSGLLRACNLFLKFYCVQGRPPSVSERRYTYIHTYIHTYYYCYYYYHYHYHYRYHYHYYHHHYYETAWL
ncbi:hypothetical protein ASPCADRAFT_205091 [Aspergillus carbonarius ITEM 5010]|uniref:Uncharacterized protein n=1 Tax=Aspergillus carbonarius (strain ITEM 5010) TaxID=602072 RepID=A0A1R3RTJ9_ASPC5|nr:hypothetical protein ASPCADRAFT_205091 [Aspergillus carbonarius ITEM 5010]